MDKHIFSELQGRQSSILESLGEDIFILPSGVPTPYIGVFRQDSNFHYLTGFPETGSLVIFDPQHDSENVTMFVKEKIRQDEVWNGFTIGVRKAQETFTADKVHNVAQLEDKLKNRFKGRTVYYKAVAEHPQSSKLAKLLETANVKTEGAPFDRMREMRVIKSEYELDQMRRAIDITGEGHHTCMRMATKHDFEYQLEAEFEYACKIRGVRQFAFGAIVAAGAHGTCQHYVENSGPIGDNDLVLIDSGASWNMYAADITRTFPSSGKFTSIQRDLYEVVLASQKAGVDAVAPGVMLHELHNISAQVLIDGLKDLKILHGPTEEIVEKNAYKDFWPGGLCHSLGLDVHDVLPPKYGGRDAEKGLEPGMVITVEPGFYSQDFNHQLPEELKHIGIRIEDDVLVTQDGHENLSSQIVKEVADVEAMVQSGA